MENTIKTDGKQIPIKKARLTWQKKVFIIVMLFVPIVEFLVFWVGVNFQSILLAFQQNKADGTVVWGFVHFENFFKEFKTVDSGLVIGIKNTFKYFFAQQLFVFPCSLLLCYFLYKKIAGYKAFRFIFYIPSIVTATVLAVLFKTAISGAGPVGTLCESLGWEEIKWLNDSEYATKTLLFYNIMFSFGGNMILLSGAMSHIDESIIEAGKIDGVGMWREIVQLVIPLIWPTLTTLIIFGVMGIFSASGPVLLFTQGGYKTTTISYWIYEKVYFAGEYNYPAAVGLVCSVIAIPLTLGVRALLNKTLETVEM